MPKYKLQVAYYILNPEGERVAKCYSEREATLILSLLNCLANDNG